MEIYFQVGSVAYQVLLGLLGVLYFTLGSALLVRWALLCLRFARRVAQGGMLVLLGFGTYAVVRAGILTAIAATKTCAGAELIIPSALYIGMRAILLFAWCTYLNQVRAYHQKEVNKLLQPCAVLIGLAGVLLFISSIVEVITGSTTLILVELAFIDAGACFCTGIATLLLARLLSLEGAPVSAEHSKPSCFPRDLHTRAFWCCNILGVYDVFRGAFVLVNSLVVMQRYPDGMILCTVAFYFVEWCALVACITLLLGRAQDGDLGDSAPTSSGLGIPICRNAVNPVD
jgi:hypothetical protein